MRRAPGARRGGHRQPPRRDRRAAGGHQLCRLHTPDPDHAGGHDNFPNAEFVVQRAQYEAAKGGQHDRFERLRPYWDVPGLRYRTVEGDTELLPGIELTETSGHVPGHQSVLVRLPQTGPVLLAIDAMSRPLGEFTPENRPVGPFDADAAATRASTRKLVDLAGREGVALLIHGHDPAQWTTLRRSPQLLLVGHSEG